MAREQRKDVDYFPHDCTHGRKMHIIEAKYGNDGYATWFKLLEQLGKANNHFIDISDEMTLMFLVSLFKIDEEKTLLILGDLAKLGSIDKTLYEQHKIIFSKKFTDSIQDAYRKRKLECFQYSDILAFAISKNAQSGGRLTEDSSTLSDISLNEAEVTPKVKYSIVEENIEKEIKVNFSFKKKLLELVNDEILVNDYIQLRKTKKATLSQTFFNLLVSECTNNNFPLDKALTICIEKNWVGFKYTWVKNIELQNKDKTDGKESTTKRNPDFKLLSAIETFTGKIE